MRDFAAYLLYRASSALIAALPLPLVFRIGEFIGLLAWLISPRYRNLARKNAAVALADGKSPTELRRLVRQNFKRLGANLFSSIKIANMAPEAIAQRVEIQNSDAMGREFRAGVPVVLILSHLSNWELFSQLMPKCFPSIRSSSIYQRLGNRWIDAHVRKTRSRTGLELFDRREGFKPVIDLLRSGGGVGILSDQHAGDNGLWTPFFGKLASSSPLPALLAKRTGAAVLAAAVYTEGVARWRMVFTERFDSPDLSLEGLTAAVNRSLEEQIRAGPEDWFWVHDRWKIPQPNFLLRRYKRGVYVPPPMSEDQLKPFRILIRSSNWLGDAVMSVPAVRAIKRGRPDTRVAVLTSANLSPMWRLIEEVDEVITANTSSVLSAARAIRRAGPFDVAVLFPNSLRTAIEVWLAGVERRVGYRGHHRSWLLNQVVKERGKPRPPEHQSRRYLRIAHELGANVREIDPNEAVRPSDGALEGGQIASGNTIRLGLCPGAEYGPAKRWLPERFTEAATTIAERHPVEWVLFGREGDSTVGGQIAGALGERCLDRIGKTTLQELIDELRTCRLLLTNDTGTMHLAGLLGVPTVAVFGSTEPQLTAPLGRNHRLIRHHVECSPCFLRKCPIDFRCMKAVTVQEVVDAISTFLKPEASL
jgi:lipopolysaccharide heptosyltransferase II